MENVEQQSVLQVEETENLQETNDVIDELKRRDLFKVYVSNVGNFMSQKEVAKLFEEHNIKGIKFALILS